MSVLLTLWLLGAPICRAQGEEDAPEEERPDEPVDLASAPALREEVRWKLWISPELGLALPLGHPGLGSGLTVGVGARPPWLEGRLLPGFQAGISAWGVNDQIRDAALEQPYDWHLSVRRLTLAPVMRARLRPAGLLSPEMGLGLELHRGVFKAEGSVDGAALGGSWEQASWAGWLCELGVAGPVRLGELRVSAGWHGERLGAASTGDVAVSTLVFALGMRVMP